MAIDIGAVFDEGFDELFSQKAVVVGGAFVLVSLVSTFLTQSLVLGLLDHLAAQGDANAAQLEQVREQLQYGLDLGLWPAVGALLAFVVLAEFVRIVAVRAFADRTTGTIDRRHYGDGLLRIFLYRVVAGIVLFVLYGFLAGVLLIPTALFPPLLLVTVPLFLYVVVPLYFAPIAVVVDEIGPLTAIQRTWDYGSGNRIRLVLVAIGVGVINLVISSPTYLFSAPTDFQSGGAGAGAFAQSAPALLVTVLVGALSSVFVVAMGVATYNNLKDDAAGPAETAGGSQEFGSSTQF